jgi:hypothetical protein
MVWNRFNAASSPLCFAPCFASSDVSLPISHGLVDGLQVDAEYFGGQ